MDWIKYYKLYSKTDRYKKKVLNSIECIEKFLNKNLNCYISWSAGKDSTALMHLVLNQKHDIKIMTEKDDMDFPGEIEYVNMMKKKYNLNLDIISPSVKLWDILINHDFTEDIHSRGTDFSDKYFYSLIKDYKKTKNYNGVFLGLRSRESKGRLNNRKMRGLIYYNKRDSEYVCQPIADWEAKDVFAYLISNNIPILDVYFKIKFVSSPEDIRKSWILPSAQTNRGQALWLKYYYPEIFYKLSLINPKMRTYV